MRLPIAMTAVLAIAAIAFAGIATPKNKVLKGTTGPGFVITTKTPAGKAVKTTKAGNYNLVVAGQVGDPQLSPARARHQQGGHDRRLHRARRP